MGINEALGKLTDKIIGWIQDFIVQLPNIVAAAFVVVLFWLLAKLVRHAVRRAARQISDYKQVNSLLATIGYIATLSTGIFVALEVVGLDKAVTALLGGAGVIGLALGFAFQDITANFISGILLSFRCPFRKGDVVSTNDFTGVVDEINLRSTELRSFQGQRVIIPNKEVYQNPLINFSRLGMRRIDLSLGVAYGDDLEKAEKLAVEAIEQIEYRDQSRDVELFYDEFGGSSVNFKLRFWIDFEKQTDFLKAQSEAIMRVKKAYDDNDITIPFPIRTLDFGVVGGEKLNEVLPSKFYDSSSPVSSNK